MTSPFATFRKYFGPLDVCPGYRWGVHLLMLAPLLAVILAVIIPFSIWGDPTRQVFENARIAHPGITRLMHWCSDYAHITFYAVYAFLFLRAVISGEERFNRDKRLFARYAVFSLLLTVLLTQLIKVSLGMPRPSVAWPPQSFAFSPLYTSFPSGHTTEVVGSALPLAFRFRRPSVYVALALLMALVGYSRLWLGAHHPVDIFGGIIMGSIVARLIYCSDQGLSASCPDAAFPGIALSDKE